MRAPFRLRTSTGPSPAPSSTRPLRDGRGGGRGGAAGRVEQREAAREQRRERGRVRAAGAVRRRHRVTLDRDLEVLAPVEEVVDGVFAVAARDERRRRAELDEPLGELAPRRAGEGRSAPPPRAGSA